MKLRLPEPNIVAADVETAALRESLREVFAALRELPVAAPWLEANGLRLISSLHADELASAERPRLVRLRWSRLNRGLRPRCSLGLHWSPTAASSTTSAPTGLRSVANSRSLS